MKDHNQLPEEGTIQEKELGTVSRLFRGFLALILVAGLLYLSGGYQYFFYSQTPSGVEQQPLTPPSGALGDAEIISLPLTVFVIENDGLYGSQRSRQSINSLLENASRIWTQAAIELELKELRNINMEDGDIQKFLRNPDVFVNNLSGFNRKTINVFLVRRLGGINGIAFGGLNSVAVADLTTIYDFRVLAHEVGHILGLSHITGRSSLMAQGVNGISLSFEEISRARRRAEIFSQ